MNARMTFRETYVRVGGWRRVLPAALLLLGLILLAACRSETGRPVPEESRRFGGAEVIQDTSALHDRLRLTQLVYVPVYSHIYTQDGDREFNLTATLSIRNTDPEVPVYVTAVRYYDSMGELVRRYVELPLRMAPLASVPFVVEERDITGGVGANFIVEWAAEQNVSSPIIEAVMISTAYQQGISFVSRGQVIRTDTAAAPSGDDGAAPRRSTQP